MEDMVPIFVGADSFLVRAGTKLSPVGLESTGLKAMVVGLLHALWEAVERRAGDISRSPNDDILGRHPLECDIVAALLSSAAMSFAPFATHFDP